MIKPSDINPLTLPFVNLEERIKLPCVPCIYFAIDSQGRIQYIGRSVNPRKRFQSHSKGFELGGISGIRIAYLETEIDLLHGIEQALIDWFQPPLNSIKKPVLAPDGNMGEIYVSKVADLRKQKNLTQRQLADLIGVDPSTIRNWERDRDGTKTFAKIAKLCEILNCTPVDLFEVQDISGD